MKYLVISDAHGNAVALRKVLEDANYDGIIFLGDAVDYGPQPSEVVDILKDLRPEIWLRGNHDEAVARRIDCGCSPKTHALSVLTREKISMKELSAEDRKFLGSRPIEVVMGKFSILCVHGAPSNPLYGYFNEENEKYMIKMHGGPVEQNYVLVGHTHIPSIFGFEEWTVMNPGSVGQPRDGDPRASYAILNTESMEFEVKRVKYDVDKVASLLREKLGNDAEKLIKILREGRV